MMGEWLRGSEKVGNFRGFGLKGKGMDIWRGMGCGVVWWGMCDFVSSGEFFGF